MNIIGNNTSITLNFTHVIVFYIVFFKMYYFINYLTDINLLTELDTALLC